MFCMHCGKELSDQAAFCPGCGNKVERPEAAPTPEPVAPAAPTAPVAPVVPEAPVVPAAPVTQTPVAPPTPAPVAPAQPVYTPPVAPPAPVQPPYAQPTMWQQPVPPAPQKGGKAWLVVLIIVLVLALIGGAIAGGVILFIADPDSSYSEMEGDGESEGETTSGETSSTGDASRGESSKGNVSNAPEAVVDDRLTPEILAGTWVTSFTMDEMLAISGSTDTLAGMPGFETDASIDLLLCFYEDGSFELLVEEAAYVNMFERFLVDYEAYLRDGGLYSVYESLGYSRDQFDALLAESEMTVDDIVDQIMSSIDTETILTSVAENLVKRDGMFVMTTDAEYTLNAETITIISSDGTEEQLKYQYEDFTIKVVDTVGEGLEPLASKELVKRATPR